MVLCLKFSCQIVDLISCGFMQCCSIYCSAFLLLELILYLHDYGTIIYNDINFWYPNPLSLSWIKISAKVINGTHVNMPLQCQLYIKLNEYVMGKALLPEEQMRYRREKLYSHYLLHFRYELIACYRNFPELGLASGYFLIMMHFCCHEFCYVVLKV